MSLSLFRTFLSLERHLASYRTCSSAVIQRHVCEIIETLRTLADDKNTENELRKAYIMDNIDLTDTQKQIVQMIVHDTTVETENSALWTCVERSVEFMLQRILQERLDGVYDTFFRLLHKIRCALLAKCTTNVKRRQHVSAILSLERIQATIASDTMVDDALSLVMSAATYVASDIATLQEYAESSKPGRHVMFIVECYYKFDIAMF